jgi:LysM repeat protein
MNSIRPLVTISILVAVGAFLYVKINQGPVGPPVPGVNRLSPSQTPVDVPPLAATANAPTADATTAPLWPATAMAVSPAASANASATDIPGTDALAPPLANVTPMVGNVAAGMPPAVPAIPELPAIPIGSDAMAAANSLPSASGLPANIPTAQYPGQSAANTSSAINGNTGVSPPINTAASGAAVPGGTPDNVFDVMAPPTNVQSAASADTPFGVPTDPNAASAAVPGDPLSLSHSATQPSNPLRQTAPPQNTATDAATAAGAPLEASFMASWPAIQTALDRGQLAQAHQLLSRWHDEPSLGPDEAQQVDHLLGQLAGTVIYSTEHQLQPARVVKPGETLADIAKEFNVPWQLLAKINGIPAADAVRPGQELKIVPGPFSAVVDLGRSQLTLLVDGRYAGKFPVTVPIGATVSEGEWLVDQKLVAPSSGVTQSAYTTAPSRVDHAIVLRSDSEAAGGTGGPTLAIASSSTPTAPGASQPAIQVSAADAEELSDILSVGSRVVIRR